MMPRNVLIDKLKQKVSIKVDGNDNVLVEEFLDSNCNVEKADSTSAGAGAGASSSCTTSPKHRTFPVSPINNNNLHSRSSSSPRTSLRSCYTVPVSALLDEANKCGLLSARSSAASRNSRHSRHTPTHSVGQGQGPGTSAAPAAQNTQNNNTIIDFLTDCEKDKTDPTLNDPLFQTNIDLEKMLKAFDLKCVLDDGDFPPPLPSLLKSTRSLQNMNRDHSDYGHFVDATRAQRQFSLGGTVGMKSRSSAMSARSARSTPKSNSHQSNLSPTRLSFAQSLHQQCGGDMTTTTPRVRSIGGTSRFVNDSNNTNNTYDEMLKSDHGHHQAHVQQPLQSPFDAYSTDRPSAPNNVNVPEDYMIMLRCIGAGRTDDERLLHAGLAIMSSDNNDCMDDFASFIGNEAQPPADVLRVSPNVPLTVPSTSTYNNTNVVPLPDVCEESSGGSSSSSSSGTSSNNLPPLHRKQSFLEVMLNKLRSTKK